MRNGWFTCRLGDLVTVKHGWPFKSEHFREPPADLPIVVAVGNFRYTGGFRFDESPVKGYDGEYPADFDLHPGDILLVMTCQTAGGEILGVPARIPDDGKKYLHNQRLGRVQVDRPEEVDSGFLYSLFGSHEFNQHLFATSSGTKILHTAPRRIEDFSFCLPPIAEQRAIAGVLGALDDKIEANRALNETLEATCQALFRSWFVDFDPVLAKSEGRRPPHLTDEVAALFPDRFEDSPGGPVPAGWRLSTIGQEVRVVGGSTPSTAVPEYWEGGLHHWITPKDLSLRPLPIAVETSRKITDQGLQKISSGLLPRGTVLLSSRAPIGYLAIAEVPLAVNQGFIAMICEGALRPHFVVRWCAANMEEIMARAGGTTFAEISKANFRPIPVVVPQGEVLAAFQAVAEPSYATIRANLEETVTLATLRDALLPRLLSGELRVRQAEQLVEEAV